MKQIYLLLIICVVAFGTSCKVKKCPAFTKYDNYKTNLIAMNTGLNKCTIFNANHSIDYQDTIIGDVVLINQLPEKKQQKSISFGAYNSGISFKDAVTISDEYLDTPESINYVTMIIWWDKNDSLHQRPFLLNEQIIVSKFK